MISSADGPKRRVVGSPPKALVRTRAEDVTIYYQQLVNGNKVNKKANLDLLVERIEKLGSKKESITVTYGIYRGEDVRRTAREAKGYLDLYAKIKGELKTHIAVSSDDRELMEFVK
jgi:hypothetical protein